MYKNTLLHSNYKFNLNGCQYSIIGNVKITMEPPSHPPFS